MQNNIHVVTATKTGVYNVYVSKQQDKFVLGSTIAIDRYVRDAMYRPVNIYITCDDEPKLNEWSYSNQLECKVIKADEQTLAHKEQLGLKKIAMTNDTDLLSDNVMSISNEFLEWFIKNPAQKIVSVKPLLSKNGNALFGYALYLDEQSKNANDMTLEDIAKAYVDNVHKETDPLERIFIAGATHAGLYTDAEVKAVVAKAVNRFALVFSKEMQEMLTDEFFEQVKK